MRNNPVFLEGINILREKLFNRVLIALYISILSVLIFVSAEGSGHILGSEFNPPDIFSFILGFVQIFSSFFLVLCYSLLLFRLETAQNWITHGDITSVILFSGKLYLSVFLSIIIVIISSPIIIYSARISTVSDKTAIYSLFFIFTVLFSYGQTWILAGFIFNNKRVIQTITIWVYLFFYLIISAKIIPGYNPVIILTTLLKISSTGLSLEIFIKTIESILLINFFFIIAGFVSANIVVRKVKVEDE